ncbi:MAG TPA: hypothetical protein VKB75_09135, partial [Jatrophihabitans sp.]|nr:hypothetical protein [Jatrophihabitans sp.]
MNSAQRNASPAGATVLLARAARYVEDLTFAGSHHRHRRGGGLRRHIVELIVSTYRRVMKQHEHPYAAFSRQPDRVIHRGVPVLVGDGALGLDELRVVQH